MRRLKQILARIDSSHDTDTIGGKLSAETQHLTRQLIGTSDTLIKVAANIKQDAQVIRVLAHSGDLEKLARGMSMCKAYNGVLKELM